MSESLRSKAAMALLAARKGRPDPEAPSEDLIEMVATDGLVSTRPLSFTVDAGVKREILESQEETRRILTSSPDFRLSGSGK